MYTTCVYMKIFKMLTLDNNRETDIMSFCRHMETPKYQSLHLTQSVDIYRDFLWGFTRLTADLHATNTMHLVANSGFPESLALQNESFGFHLSATYNSCVGFWTALLVLPHEHRPTDDLYAKIQLQSIQPDHAYISYHSYNYVHSQNRRTFILERVTIFTRSYTKVVKNCGF